MSRKPNNNLTIYPLIQFNFESPFTHNVHSWELYENEFYYRIQIEEIRKLKPWTLLNLTLHSPFLQLDVRFYCWENQCYVPSILFFQKYRQNLTKAKKKRRWRVKKVLICVFLLLRIHHHHPHQSHRILFMKDKCRE